VVEQLEFRDDAFAGRSVVVIGGTSGIGAAIACAFAGLEAEVIAAGLSSGEAPDAARAVAEVVELDVTSGEDIERFFRLRGRLDVLVNCAGVIERRDEYQTDVFRRVLEVNLVGTMRSCVAARELLMSTRGCIVNVASMTSYFASPHAPGYGASKAAIVQLTKSLASEFAPHVRVNAVAPGWIRTDLTSVLQSDSEISRQIVDRTPAGRWGCPADVTGPVICLASQAAAFVTGAVLPVDGGYSCV
jgi:NAD(P)-dependent dehydrogenase (short-subunit alcohol dehydrogenase family)